MIPNQGVIRDQMIAVNSSNLATVRYNKDDSLTVWFKGGGVYRYDRVPEEVVYALLTADSIGAYFHKHIRQVYSYTNLTESKEI